LIGQEDFEMKEIQQKIRQGIRDLEAIIDQVEVWRRKYGYYDKAVRTDTAKHSFYMLLKELKDSIDLY